MKNIRKTISIFSGGSFMALLSLSGCGITPVSTSAAPQSSNSSIDTSVSSESSSSENPALLADGTYSLDLGRYSWSYQGVINRVSSSVECYYIKNVVYCAKPTNPELQCLNIYVPTAYLHSDGTIDENGIVNGYTAKTAPILFQNSCGSYYGYAPYTILAGKDNGTGKGWYFDYLAKGYVLVFAGERGINTVDSDKRVIGTAPVSLADLKSGLRFLRHNQGKFPGNTEKIISQGMSAGGAMSSLIGTSGNSNFFDSYLQQEGAVMDEKDDVFADQAYCPIIDLDHASLAYEWTYRSDKTTFASTYTPFTSALSDKMAERYATYLNSLALTDEEGNPLTLAEDGNQSGSLYKWVLSQYEKGYEKAIEEGKTPVEGTYDWIQYDSNKETATMIPTVKGTALESLVNSGYITRKKGCLSFDNLAKTGDNRVFGVPLAVEGSASATRHFTVDLPELISQEKDTYLEDYSSYYDAYKNDVTSEEVLTMIRYYSPYQYLRDKKTNIAPHFRINVGTEDSDTSPLVSSVFSRLLAQDGVEVQYNLVWGFGHIDADDPNDFLNWAESFCHE